MSQKILLAALGFQAVVRPAPDAFEIMHLAFAVAGSAAGAVALVLGAL